MTVPVEIPFTTFTGDGSTTSFVVPFSWTESGDVQANYTAGGVTTSAGYSITGTSGNSHVVFSVAPPAGAIGAIWRQTPVEQEQSTPFASGGAFPNQALMAGLDAVTRMIAELNLQLAACVRGPLGDTIQILPPATVRAGSYFAWDATGKIPIAASGTGADASLRADLAAPTGGAIVGFQQSGTGAVGRTIQAKAGEGVSILDYGGAADDETDNYPALMDAIAAFQASNGNPDYVAGPRIRFPWAPLPYYFSEPVNLKTTVILEGDTSPYALNGLATVLRFPESTPGFIVNRYNTLGSTTLTTPTTGADGSTFRNLAIVGGGGPVDYTGNTAGIWARAQVTIEDCYVADFAGNNVQIVATSGAGGAAEGQASGYKIDGLYVNGSGLHGVYIQGGDANVGSTNRINVHSAGAGGLIDLSFLGSTHISTQIDDCNANNQCQVSYTDGNAYQLIDHTPGIGASTTPGTNAAIWYPLGTTTQFPGHPAWSNAGTYVIGSPLFVQSGGPAPDNFISPYIEGGLPLAHLGSASIAFNPINGAANFTNTTPVWFNDGGVGSFVMSGFRLAQNTPFQSGGNSYFSLAGLGEGGANYAGTIINYTNTLNWPLSFRLATNFEEGSDADIAFSYAFSDQYQYFTGPNTTQTFGRTAPVPYVSGFPQVAIGSGANARIMANGTAAPTTGYHAQGEFVWNIAPTATGTLGWSCTASGTPGTWTAVTVP